MPDTVPCVSDGRTSEILSLCLRCQCDGAVQLLSGLIRAYEGAMGTQSSVGQSSLRSDARLEA